jgi:hypothetical protein
MSASQVKACLLSSLLVAQAIADDEPEKPKQHHLGILVYTPKIELKNVGVESNVFETLQDPVRDDLVVVGPRVDGELPLSDRFHVTGMGFLEEDYFRRQGQERATSFYGEGEALLDWDALKLRGGGGGGQFTERLSIEVGDRLTHQESRGHLGAEWRLSRHLSATVKGSDETFTYSPGLFRFGGNIKDALDRNTLAGAVELRYIVTSMTKAVLKAEAARDNFFSQPEIFPRAHQSYRYLAGFELGQRAAISGTLLAGVVNFPGTINQGVASYTGPVVSADLTLPLFGRVRLHGVGERDVQYGANLVEVGSFPYRNSFILTRYLGDGIVDLPWRLSVFVSGGFEGAHYLLPYPIPDEPVFTTRVDHRWSAGGGLERRFGSTLKIGGHILWARRVSSVLLYSYEDVRYGLTAEVTP